MKTPQTATLIAPTAGQTNSFDPIKEDLSCTNVLPQRDRTAYGQRLYAVFFPPAYTAFNNAQHLIINNRRYAIQDVTRLPDDQPKAVKIMMTLFDPDFDTIGNPQVP